MKTSLRLFFISLISLSSLIICNCGEDNKNRENLPLSSKDEQIRRQERGQKIVQFTVQGIVCENCKGKLATALENTDGVFAADVYLNVDKNNVVVAYNPEKTSIDKIKKVITDLGKSITETNEV